MLYTWRTKTVVVPQAVAGTTSTGSKNNRSTLSSGEALDAPILSQHTLIRTHSYYDGVLSDSESDSGQDSGGGNFQGSGHTYGERDFSLSYDDNREGSAYDKMYLHQTNLIDERLSIDC